MNILKRLKLKWIAHGLFWSWNLIYLLLIGVLFQNYFHYRRTWGEIATELFSGDYPFSCSFFLLLLFLLAPLSMIVGWVKFRKTPGRLIAFFYGIEVPLFFISLIRLILFREITASVGYLLILLSVGIAAFSWGLFRSNRDFPTEILPSPLLRQKIRFQIFRNMMEGLGHFALFCVMSYFALLLSFYVVPLLHVLGVGFFQFEWLSALTKELQYNHGSGLLLVLVSGLFLTYTATLFIAFPISLFFLYGKACLASWRRLSAFFGVRPLWTALALGLLLHAGIFILLKSQPQQTAFRLLEKEPLTLKDKTELISKSETLRKGLLNAYLAPYRYLSSREENNHIKVMYESELKAPPEISKALQLFYSALASPFLYNTTTPLDDSERGDIYSPETTRLRGMEDDQHRAAELYEQFFDIPIQKGEKQAINHALHSTLDTDTVQAGLLNIDTRTVFLLDQEVSVQEHEDWAQVEIHEHYQNQTRRTQELFYSFELPEDAVVTGLWLGETSDRAKRVPFQVSTRGAAQKVYNQQVRERVDPALIEQTGPRQYRLRAFPIPWRNTFSTLPQSDELHLWFTYKILERAGENQGLKGRWILPRLIESRNVFWSYKTKRSLDGQPWKVENREEWLPLSVASHQNFMRGSHHVVLPDGETMEVQGISNAFPREVKSSPVSKKRCAVLMDSSYSMHRIKEKLAEALLDLEQNPSCAWDVFWSDQLKNQENPTFPGAVFPYGFEQASFTFFGNQTLLNLLQQFTSSSVVKKRNSENPYEALFVLTDESGFDLEKEERKDFAFEFTQPVWIIHLGEKLPVAYPDVIADLIYKNGGGVAKNMKEVLMAPSLTSRCPETKVVQLEPCFTNSIYNGGYAWSIGSKTNEAPTTDGFEDLALKQYLLHAMKNLGRTVQANEPAKLALLDHLHDLAKNYEIVTPYSSMIVLVNDRQKEALKNAEKAEDRFARQNENGVEVLSKPSNPFQVSGVPEPEEWMLLICGGLGMIYLIYQKKRNFACP